MSPYEDVKSVMPSSETMRSMSHLGTGLPATMPVRSLLCQPAGRGTSIMDSIIAGTPWSAVQFSVEMACMQAMGSKASAGKTMVEPWVRTARTPRVRPKQWKRGGGQQRVSEGLSCMRSPMKRELLMRLLWCEFVSLAGHTSKRVEERRREGRRLTSVLTWLLLACLCFHW